MNSDIGSPDGPGPDSVIDTPEMKRVESMLRDPASWPIVPAPAGLHGRVMVSVSATRPRRSPLKLIGVRAGALLAAAVAIAAVGVYLLRPSPAPPVEAVAGTSIGLAVSPEPMIRLVGGTLDRPLREETERMISDTRRAARALVQCVPFTGRGG